jgi:hypothetical protein
MLLDRMCEGKFPGRKGDKFANGACLAHGQLYRRRGNSVLVDYFENLIAHLENISPRYRQMLDLVRAKYKKDVKIYASPDASGRGDREQRCRSDTKMDQHGDLRRQERQADCRSVPGSSKRFFPHRQLRDVTMQWTHFTDCIRLQSPITAIKPTTTTA